MTVDPDIRRLNDGTIQYAIDKLTRINGDLEKTLFDDDSWHRVEAICLTRGIPKQQIAEYREYRQREWIKENSTVTLATPWRITRSTSISSLQEKSRQAFLTDSPPTPTIIQPSQDMATENGTSIQATADIKSLVPMVVKHDSQRDLILFVSPDATLGDIAKLAGEASRHLRNAPSVLTIEIREDTDD